MIQKGFQEMFIKCINIVWEVCIVGVILCLEAKELVSCRDSPSQSSSLSLTSAIVASIATAIATVASIATGVLNFLHFVHCSSIATLWTQAMSRHHVKPNQPQSAKIEIRNVIVYLSNFG